MAWVTRFPQRKCPSWELLERCVKLGDLICCSSGWKREMGLAVVVSLVRGRWDIYFLAKDWKEDWVSQGLNQVCGRFMEPLESLLGVGLTGRCPGCFDGTWTQEQWACHLFQILYGLLNMLHQIVDGTVCSHCGVWKLSRDAFVSCGLFPVFLTPPSRLLTVIHQKERKIIW